MVKLRSVFLALSILILIGCDGPDMKPPVVVGLFGFDGYEPFYWAESLGYYPRKSVHLVETPVDLGLMQAFRGSTVSAQGLTLTRALRWEQEEVNGVIVMPIMWSNGLDRLVSRPGIQTVSELKGARIGIEFGTISEYLLMRALQEVGLTFDDVELVSAQNDVLVSYLMAGEVDAISAFGSDVEALQDDFPILRSSADFPGEMLDVMVVRSDYLLANPEPIEDLIYGFLKATDYFEGLKKTGGFMQRLPRGIVPDNQTVSDIKEVSFFNADRALELMQDEAVALRDLMEARRSIIEPRFAYDVKPLPIDTKPFFSALRRLQEERK